MDSFKSIRAGTILTETIADMLIGKDPAKKQQAIDVCTDYVRALARDEGYELPVGYPGEIAERLVADIEGIHLYEYDLIHGVCDIPEILHKRLQRYGKKKAKPLEDSYGLDPIRSLRDDSGKVEDICPVVELLYELMRDHLPTAKLEGIVQGMEQYAYRRRNWQPSSIVFTNGWLAQYAQNLAARLFAIKKRRGPIKEEPANAVRNTSPGCGNSDLHCGVT